MDERVKGLLYGVGGRVFDYAFGRLTSPRRNPIEERIQHIDRLIQAIPADRDVPVIVPPQTPKTGYEVPLEGNPTAGEEIATGCVPCAVSHFSVSAGLLNEAVRFKGEGMTSNEILDRIAGTIEEQNALERVDLSPAKIQRLPDWQKLIAEEALSQSRQLRHRLEGIQTIDELLQLAADTKRYYIKLNRQWYRGRFDHMGAGKAELANYFKPDEGDENA